MTHDSLLHGSGPLARAQVRLQAASHSAVDARIVEAVFGLASVARRGRAKLSREWRSGYRVLVVDRRLRRLRREERVECWCGGALIPFRWHRSYGVCASCGTYVNRMPIAGEGLEGLYGFDLYWHRKQRADGLPPIEKRPALDASDGRVERWLELVERFGGAPGTAVEIGCSHGLLLTELGQRGWRCIGVEVDPELAAWTAGRTGAEVRAGVFPGPELPRCDLFLAFDVLEHAADPLVFLREAARLLTPGRHAVIQTAIEREGLEPPFGPRFADAFDPIEHTFLFTDESMRRLATSAGLEIVSETERLWRLGEIVVMRKPVPADGAL